MAEVLSHTKCELGEGAFWHPKRQQFFWFDILGKRLLTIENGQERKWQFDDYVSAAGWVDYDTMVLASATALWHFDLRDGSKTQLVELEADNPVTRCNDGRADPWGGFWIGTMGIKAEDKAGAIYRYYKGELRVLVPNVTITNAICFAPDRSVAYYTDTKVNKVMRQPLNKETGWPEGKAELFLDLSGEEFGADGAVVDAQGNFWNAQWGASRVACYSPDGDLIGVHGVPAKQASCPSFGGKNLDQLYVTTAAEGLNDPEAGKTYVIQTSAKGQQENQVIL